MSTLDPFALLELVGELAREIDPGRPETVTQRAFDAAALASEDPRYRGLPRAKHISRMLLQGWGDLVELSLRGEQGRERALAQRQRTEEASWLTHEQAAYALRLAACRLGWVTSVSEAEYRGVCEQLAPAAAAAGAVNGAGAELAEASIVIPSCNQILGLFGGDWNLALEDAGLEPRALSAEDRTRPRPAPPTIIEVLNRCFEAHGAEPTTSELALFARANGIPYPRKEIGRPFSDYVREWREQRLAAGLEVPDGPPRKRDRPDYGRDVGAAREEDGARHEKWDFDSCLPWARRYLAELPRGGRSSQRGYDDWARGQSGAPWASAFVRHGGFSNMMRAARRGGGGGGGGENVVVAADDDHDVTRGA